uniref:Hypothetical secreted protein 570 n=1 Tax=Amblyomma variegatum TaxID=34610 RepID=F0JA62_AMBVA|nr:TPA_inf: hypothetical secreted protein 570 [Amblyomma variegatum]
MILDQGMILKSLHIFLEAVTAVAGVTRHRNRMFWHIRHTNCFSSCLHWSSPLLTCVTQGRCRKSMTSLISVVVRKKYTATTNKSLSSFAAHSSPT